mmetsp:Transcript_25806/g.43520  ORF Transcript_25806/g.43520 Transcript_25806/m.43520 type:complete len:261 (-) Transcript_25806:189-971(-)
MDSDSAGGTILSSLPESTTVGMVIRDAAARGDMCRISNPYLEETLCRSTWRAGDSSKPGTGTLLDDVYSDARPCMLVKGESRISATTEPRRVSLYAPKNIAALAAPMERPHNTKRRQPRPSRYAITAHMSSFSCTPRLTLAPSELPQPAKSKPHTVHLAVAAIDIIRVLTTSTRLPLLGCRYRMHDSESPSRGLINSHTLPLTASPRLFFTLKSLRLYSTPLYLTRGGPRSETEYWARGGRHIAVVIPSNIAKIHDNSTK